MDEPFLRQRSKSVDSDATAAARSRLHTSMAVVDPFHPGAVLRTADATQASVLDWSSWLTAFLTALPLSLVSYSSCISYAHLIVSGAYGIPVRAIVIGSMHLFSSGLTGLILPLRSKCPLVIPSADISVTIFYQQVVNDIIASAREENLSDESIAATIMLALPVTTVLMSLVFYFVGAKKKSVVVSYLPYPIIAGFLGSIGAAIFMGSFGLIAGGLSPGPAGVMQAGREKPWQVSCAVFMAVGTIFLRMLGLPGRMPGVLPDILALSLFWIIAFTMGYSADALRKEGWMFEPSSFDPFWIMWSEQRLDLVSFQLVLPRVSTFLGLGLVLLLSLTLRIAGIEGSTGFMLGIDEEVKWTGLVSMGAGCCGTVIGFQSPGLTLLNAEAGSSGVHVAVLTALLQLLVWSIGFPVLNFVPRFLLSGILMKLGLLMIWEWLWVARHKVGLLGLLVIYAQVGSSVVHGLILSVLVGALVALLTAQIQLMKLHVLKYHVSGASVTSCQSRTAAEVELLRARSHCFECLGLEGFLSEGPMIKFSNYLHYHIEQNTNVSFLIFDLNACQGVNVSACALLAKLYKVLEHRGITTFFCNIEAGMSAKLKSFGIPEDQVVGFGTPYASSFTRALALCEDLIIASDGGAVSHVPDLHPSKAEAQLALQSFLGMADDEIDVFITAGVLSQQNLGTELVSQGSMAHVLYVAIPGHSEVNEVVDMSACHGEPQQLVITRLGALCGAESVLFDESIRSTWSATVRGGWFFSIAKTELRRFLQDHPSSHASMCRVASRQLLQHRNAVRQLLKLSQGGGWRGAYFDRWTARASLESGNSREFNDRMRKRNTIENWQKRWMQCRGEQFTSPL